jgi:hypothetical protein
LLDDASAGPEAIHTRHEFYGDWNYDIRPAAEVDEHDGVDPDAGPTRSRQRM